MDECVKIDWGGDCTVDRKYRQSLLGDTLEGGLLQLTSIANRPAVQIQLSTASQPGGAAQSKRFPN